MADEVIQLELLNEYSVTNNSATDNSVTDPKTLSVSPANPRLPARMKIFLQAYAETSSIAKAAAAANVSRLTHYRKLKEDPAYREAFEAIGRQIGEEVQTGVVERAIHGTKRQLFYQGEPVLLEGNYVYETDYDNQLSLTVLRHFLPEWRERITQDVNINLADRLKASDDRMLPYAGDPDGDA